MSVKNYLKEIETLSEKEALNYLQELADEMKERVISTESDYFAKGRIIYGIGCGLITMFIRICGGYPEGVSFAILVMNCLAWYIDKFTKPRVFGGAKKNEKK